MMNELETFASIEEVKRIMCNSINEAFHPKEIARKNYQKVEIKTCKDAPVSPQIFIGGQKIEGIRSWTLTHKAGDIPRLHLDINAMNLDIDNEAVCTAEGWGDFAMRMIDPCSGEM